MIGQGDSGLAEVMASVARRLDEPVPVDVVLQRILVAARDTVSGVRYAGISVIRRGGKIETVASTDPLVLELDELQYQLGEGPCIDAVRGMGQWECWVDDLSTDPRWPNYAPKAAALGVMSQMGLELFSEADTIGALNLFSDAADAFDRDTPYIAQLFATHAAHAMGNAMRQEQLTASIASRTVIGQAMGIVMGRYNLDEHRAFSFLKRTSQDSNIKLHDVARTMVNQANEMARSRDSAGGEHPQSPPL